MPLGTKPETTPAGGIGFNEALARLNTDTARGEVWPLDRVEERFRSCTGCFDQVDRGVDQLKGIVRRNAGRHADRDARCTISKQVGKSCGENRGFLPLSVIGVAEVDGIFIDSFEQKFGRFGQSAFRIPHSGSVIAIDVSEISLPIDQRDPDRKVLHQAHERIIDRLVAMGMEITHNVANDFRGLLVATVRREAHRAHAVKDAPVNRFQAIPHIGKRPRRDC